MDFYKIKESSNKKDQVDVYPDFLVARSRDLMIRGKSFYAIWDENAGLWSTDEFDVQRLVDEDLNRYRDKMSVRPGEILNVRHMADFSSGSWKAFRNYLSLLSDSSHQLDAKLTWANTEVKKGDYVSRRLPYPLQSGSIAAYDELISTLYNPSERDKLEWAIGAIVAGDAKDIQKFVVLYGPAGAGKSTVLNIIQSLFTGYYTTFEAKALTGNNNAFSTEVFKTNPLVAIQHDGDLSRIEDNTKLNSIVSHEEMTMNEKYKPSYTARINAFLFMGTNKPVKITDAKSGIIRRLIDVQPSGNKVPTKRYHALMSQIEFELGAIAWHCLERYREMGKNYYSGYRPIEMMLQTDVFLNYIESYFDVFKTQDGVTLNQAYEMYKAYAADSKLEYQMPKYRFREELKNYFRDFDERTVVGGERVRSYFSGFVTDHFAIPTPEEHALPLVLEHNASVIDSDLAEQPAQYATANGTPIKRWAEVTTTLADIDTSKEHFVRPPLNHIVIDFDIKDAAGNKSAALNLEAASKWPSTYAEWSRGGAGIHLHYIYDGDVTELSHLYEEDIEIKVFTGASSLRRMLSTCNTVPVAVLNSGLPLKERKMISTDTIKSEKGLREMIVRNLRKEFHAGTKPSMDFIWKILDEAYSSGMEYDVSDMRGDIQVFANNSSNQAPYCLKLLQTMKWKSEPREGVTVPVESLDERLTFFDVEVFKNLFIVCWKYAGDSNMVTMINPSPQEIEPLLRHRLVGFNNRRYDNHILYARFMGYSNEELYNLSQKIISGARNALFGEAYNLSWTDIYDYAAIKQGLKKWQIELKIFHKENHHPWDQPVAEEFWEEIAAYCANDVISTEVVHNYLSADYKAREILAALSGLSCNDTTQQHAAKIIFGDDKNPQDKFVYTDLATGRRWQGAREIDRDPICFEGYTFELGKSMYRGEEIGEGGYVHGEPGMYTEISLEDVASMHPASIEALELFGPYTKKFSELKQARIAIKRKDLDTVAKVLNGALKPFVKDATDDDLARLSYALKIVINIVYGLTAAKFDNKFRDVRNKDNIVAKRGALFMVDLKHFVQERGFKVVHIKTDSIKVANATPEIIDLIMEFGMSYGYEFEHEATYDRLCLVNDAVYVAHARDGRKPAHWTAVGAQFQHPFVFKTLFSQEPIEFDDFCEAKSVTTALYLNPNGEDTPMGLERERHFVGRVGSFVPIVDHNYGGRLEREKDGKFYAANGSKGYWWVEADVAREFNLEIDMTYFHDLVDAALDNLKQYGDVEWFLA